MSLSQKYSIFLQKYKYFVLLFWIVTSGVSIWATPKLFANTRTTLDAPVDSPSYDAVQRISSEFPSKSNGSTVIIVLRSDSEKETIVSDESRLFFNEMEKWFSNYSVDPFIPVSYMGYYSFLDNNMGLVADQFKSKNNRSMLIVMSINGSTISGQMHFVENIRPKVRSLEKEILRPRASAIVTGFMVEMLDSKLAAVTDFERMDIYVLPIALFVLGIVLKSARLMIIPVCTILGGGLLAFLITYPISNVIDVAGFCTTFMLSTMIAMSFDYSLFLLTRYREEVFAGRNQIDAVRVVLATTGKIIIVSGSTITICFLGMVFFPLDSMISLGIACAISICCCLVANLTLVPSLLLIFDSFFRNLVDFTWVDAFRSCCCRKKKGEMELNESLLQEKNENEKNENEKNPSIWLELGRHTVKHPYIAIIIIVACCVPFAMNVPKLDTTMEVEMMIPNNCESARGIQLLREDFSAGFLGPYYLLVQTNDVILSPDFFRESSSMIEKMAREINDVHLNGFNGVMEVQGTRIDESWAFIYLNVWDSPAYSSPQGVAYRYFWNELVNSQNSSTLVEVHSDSDPFGPAARDMVTQFRRSIANRVDCMNYTVTLSGGATILIDMVDITYSVYPTVVVVIVVTIFFIAALMFRSAFVPIRLILTVFFTLAWVYGFAVMIFQFGIFNGIFPTLKDFHQIYWVIPIACFCIIVGLGLDYDVFLLGRVQEYREEGFSDVDAVLKGLDMTGGTISAAGIIMCLAFGGLLLSDLMIVNQFGFFVCFSVFLDTFVVRTVLVPAIMSAAGKWNWWPKKMPVPDYEGNLFTKNSVIN